MPHPPGGAGRGRRPGGKEARPAGGRKAAALVLALCGALSLPLAARGAVLAWLYAAAGPGSAAAAALGGMATWRDAALGAAYMAAPAALFAASALLRRRGRRPGRHLMRKPGRYLMRKEGRPPRA